jgi:hypothetical protein
MTYLASNKTITLPELARMKREGEKIAMLTCYDASFAALEDRCGVDVMLVGDSLGNVIQGKTSTLPVTMEHMAYHTACVAALPITSRRSRPFATPASCWPPAPRWSSSKAAKSWPRPCISWSSAVCRFAPTSA